MTKSTSGESERSWWLYLEVLARSRYLVLMDDSVSSHAKVTLRELRDWREGVKMPTFREGFDRWWLATLVRHRLPVTLYAVQNPAPAWEMPLTSVEWDEPAYNYLSQFRRRTDARKTGR